MGRECDPKVPQFTLDENLTQKSPVNMGREEGPTFLVNSLAIPQNTEVNMCGNPKLKALHTA